MKIRFILLLSILLGLTISCKTDNSKQEVSQVQEVSEWKPEDTRSLTGVMAKRGLITKTDKASQGYVLFEPTSSTKSFIIDMDGKVVHKWESDLSSNHAYLLENGHLLKLEKTDDIVTFAFGGMVTKLREYDWEGNVVWEFDYSNEKTIMNHDIEVLPNGNILAFAYEAVNQEDAIMAGRDPKTVTSAGLWIDKIIEIKPIKPKGGEIVWEWRTMDHLVQDFDETKANYGVVSEHPEKIDINIPSSHDFAYMDSEQFEQAMKNGMGMKNSTFENQHSEVTHGNAISYNSELDQIVFSFKYFNEIYVLDHSTTTDEAKGNTGGKYGHGGNLLYRWGNPSNYKRGTKEDQKLFLQHDVKFIPKGYPGEGNLLLFNNDIHDPNGKYPSAGEAFVHVKMSPEINFTIEEISNFSAVYEFTPPKSVDGSYFISTDGTFGPSEPSWVYTAPDKYSMYAPFVSGAQRLSNGNTFITEGTRGRFFEVTPDKQIIWEYWNPYFYDYKLPDGSAPDPAGPFVYYQFRGTFFDKDFPAFKGKDLKPIEPQPEPFVFKMPPPPPVQNNDTIH